MDKKKDTADKVKEQFVNYDIYAEMPDDGHRYEIFNGKLEMMSPGPSSTHQTVSGELYLLLQSCRSDYKIFSAPLDVILSDLNVVQPDIIMIHRSRVHIVTTRGIEGSPDLVIEILSPSSHKRDRMIKQRIYAQHGVPEYWIVDSDARTLERLKLGSDGLYVLIHLFEGNDLVNSDMLPCVSFAINDVFRDVLN